MPEIKDIRIKSSRVKAHILNRFLALAEKVDEGEKLEREDKQLYNDLLMTFAKNVVPRTQEITGEDGQPISISFDPVFSGK